MLEGPVWNEPTLSKPCAWRPLHPSTGVPAGSLWRGLSKSWGQAASVVRSAHGVGTEVPFAKAHMRYKVAARVSMPSQPEGAHVPQPISRTCCWLSKPSSIARAKQPPHCAQHGCTPGCVPLKSGANASHGRAPGRRSGPPCRRSLPRSTAWATCPKKSPKVSRKKQPSHRGARCPGAPEQAGRR